MSDNRINNIRKFIIPSDFVEIHKLSLECKSARFKAKETKYGIAMAQFRRECARQEAEEKAKSAEKQARDEEQQAEEKQRQREREHESKGS